MSRIKCLHDVIAEIETSPRFDETTRKKVVESLRSVMMDEKLTAEQKKAKIARLAEHQRKELWQSTVVKQFDENWQERTLAWLDSLDEADRATALRNWVENESNYNAVTTTSVAARARALEATTLGRLNDLFRHVMDNRVPWMRDSEYAKVFHRELRGIDTGNKKAKEHVKIFRETVNPLLERLRQSGVYVGYTENWGPQSHAPSKITGNLDHWRKFLLENLDTDWHPDPESTVESLFRTLQTRHLSDPEGTTISLGREIRFKTPEAEFEYFNLYGEAGFGEALHHAVRSLARKTVLVEEFGPSGARNVEFIRKDLQRRAALHRAEAEARGDKEAARKWSKDESKLSRVEWIVASETGALQTPANLKVANFMGAGRQWMITQFLGFVSTLIATQDSIVSMFSTRFHTGGFASSVGEQIRNIKAVIGDEHARQWAEEMGVWTHALHAAAVDRFSTPFAATERMKGIAGQSATAVQRLAGTYFMERSLRSATMLTISRSLGRMSKLDWLDLHPKYRKVLEANGWTQGKWQKFRSVATLDEALGTVNVLELPQDLREHALAFLYRETDLAVVYPQHYDRALLTLGARAGTAPGELAAVATQFWSWPIAFIRGPLRRELAMGGAGFVGFSAGMMAAGALGTQVYAILNNEPTFEWDSPTLWKRAAMRSGLLTPVGDMVMQILMYDKMDLGPLGSQFDNVVSTIGNAGMALTMGEAEKAARPLAKMVKDLVVPNLWWTEVSLTSRAMDYLMWELDPQYMRSRERRWRNEGRRM